MLTQLPKCLIQNSQVKPWGMDIFPVPLHCKILPTNWKGIYSKWEELSYGIPLEAHFSFENIIT